MCTTDSRRSASDPQRLPGIRGGEPPRVVFVRSEPVYKKWFARFSTGGVRGGEYRSSFFVFALPVWISSTPPARPGRFSSQRLPWPVSSPAAPARDPRRTARSRSNKLRNRKPHPMMTRARRRLATWCPTTQRRTMGSSPPTGRPTRESVSTPRSRTDVCESMGSCVVDTGGVWCRYAARGGH